MKGLVVYLNESYGYVTDDAGLRYYFNDKCLHGRTELSMLAPGSEVDFKPVETPFGLRAKHVSIKTKPPFVWEEGALYVDYTSKRMLRWRKGDSTRFEANHRALVSKEFITDYFQTREEARDDFYEQILPAGVNFIQDLEIETQVRLDLGNASMFYRYRAVAGVYVKVKKVKSLDQADYFNGIFKPFIDERLALFHEAEAQGRQDQPGQVELKVA